MTGRSTFPVAATLAAGAALAGVARFEAFPSAVAWAFAAAGALRLGLGRDGGALLPRLAVGLLGATALAFGSIYLLHALAGEAAHPLVALLALVAALQTVLLFGAITPFRGFLLLLGASTHLSGGAFLATDGPGVAATLGAFALLVWALVLLERHAVAVRQERREGAVRRVRVGGTGAGGAGAHARTALGLAGVALGAGALLFLALPRAEGMPRLSWGGGGATAPPEGVPAETGGAGGDDAFRTFKTGVDRAATGIRLGDVGRIKRDLTPYLAVEATGWGGDLRGLYLRANVVDTFTRGGWYPTVEDDRPLRISDEDDGSTDGWVELGPADDASGHDLRITFLEGLTQRKEGWSLLFLQPETVRLRLERPGRGVARYVLERADLKRFAPWRLAQGDVLDCRVVEPRPDRGSLLAARSDPSVAPLPVHVQLPAELAPLRDVALGVVGGERNPWRRAELLEAWLHREFRYTLSVPPMGDDPHAAVLAFVRDVRRGHCEYFASALALLLRSLGHPTRVAFGFRGGDLQESPRQAIVRGVHAHLWPEMFLAGQGWVLLEPTPPDREALDAATVTRTGEAGHGAEAGGEPGPEPLRFDAEARRRFWAGIGDALSRALRAAGEVAFGARGLYVGWPVLLLLAALLARAERRSRRVRDAVGRGRRLPPGAYGEALLLLADHGLRRRRVQTAGEFGRLVARHVPAGEGPLDRLTTAYERDRFGGVAPGPGEVAASAGALDALRRALEEAEGGRGRG